MFSEGVANGGGSMPSGERDHIVFVEVHDIPFAHFPNWNRKRDSIHPKMNSSLQNLPRPRRSKNRQRLFPAL